MYRRMLKKNIVSLKILIASILALIGCTGCGDFFEKKPTEVETQEILTELEQVRENPYTKNPLPDIYKQPPKKLPSKEGVKLLYYTKHHSADSLAQLIIEQFAASPPTEKGYRALLKGYSVSSLPATNQLIVQCPSEEDADAILQFLDATDVPPIQVNIDCMVLERFADVTMDWETTILIENFLGEGITFGADKFPDPAFPGAALREQKRAIFGLDIGYWIQENQPGHRVRAAIDLLVSRGYLKILMNPTLETVNGKEANIQSREHVPLEQTVTGAGVEPYSITTYQWVSDSLTVTPYVYADGSIGLTTEIKIGSSSKPEGVVQKSIITERSSKVMENRIMPGKSLVIGGLRKAEQRSVIRGIPFFKDLPLIGTLFSSKDYEEKGTEVIFVLTPSISSNGIDNREMVKDISKKYQSPKLQPGWTDVITDPLSGSIYTEHVEQKAIEAEVERLKAQLESEELSREVTEIRALLEKARQIAQEQKVKAQQAHKEALEAKKIAEKAQQQVKAAEAAQKDAEVEKNAALAAQKRAEQAAEKARIQKQKALEAQEIKEKAEEVAEQARQKAQQEQNNEPEPDPNAPDAENNNQTQ